MAPRTPLVDPAGYFQSRPEPFTQGAAVFLAYHALVACWLFAVGIALVPVGEALALLLEIVTVAVIGSAVGWAIVGTIMHVGSGGSKTNGSLTDALAVAGWTFAPQAIVFVPLAVYSLWEVGRTSVGSGAEFFAEFATATPVAELSALALVVTILWSIYVLTYGVATTHDALPKVTVFPAFAVGFLLFFGGIAGP